MRQSRPIPEGFKLKQVRIVRRVSGWYGMLILKLEVDVPDPLPHGEPLGIDLGLEKFLAASNGRLIARPRFFVSLQSKLKSASAGRGTSTEKACLKVAKLHEHISNTRKDFHYKVANQLCDEAGMVFAEDLNLKAMSSLKTA